MMEARTAICLRAPARQAVRDGQKRRHKPDRVDDHEQRHQRGDEIIERHDMISLAPIGMDRRHYS